MNIRAFGPGPEFLFLAEGGIGGFEGDGLALDSKLLGVEIAATKPGDIGGELAEAGSFGERIEFGGDEGPGSGGILDGDPASEVVVEAISEFFIAQDCSSFKLLARARASWRTS